MMTKLLLTLTLLISSSVFAAPLQIILPYAPGGGTEITARRFQKFLQEKKNIESVIMYKPGAEGVVGTIDISKSPADGSVIGITAPIAVIESQEKGSDVELVSMLEIPTLLLVSNKFKTFDELKNQKNIKFGVGSEPQKRSIQLLTKILNKNDSILASYKGGGPVLNDLLGGHIDVAFLPAPIVLQMVESKKLEVLGSTSSLTAKYKNWVNYAGYCLVLPKDASAETVKLWDSLVKEYLADPEIQKDIVLNLGTITPGGKEFLKQNINKIRLPIVF